VENLLKVPQFFFDYCRICGWGNAETEKAWKEIIIKSISDFISWVDKEVLEENERKILDDMARANDSKGENMFAKLLGMLPKEKHDQFSSEFIKSLTANLDGFYETLKQKQTDAQKQALGALLLTDQP
jgi:hypothetical protein